jgi:hypothetical protein
VYAPPYKPIYNNPILLFGMNIFINKADLKSAPVHHQVSPLPAQILETPTCIILI